MLAHLQRPDAFWPQIVSDLVCLGHGPDTKRVLSSPLDRLGGDCPQRRRPPAAFISGRFGLRAGIQEKYDFIQILLHITKPNEV
jgi:hypothetical protein